MRAGELALGLDGLGVFYFVPMFCSGVQAHSVHLGGL